MPRITTRDGTELYVKDWGSGPPVILIHGYPLNADSFDRTAMKLAEAGHRVINYDRRGFGRSDQPWGGYDWDTYADDLADVMRATGATDDVTVIGYSMGGGECARYMSRHGGKGVVRLGLYASVVPGMLKAEDNPAGHTPADYEDIVAGIEKDAAAFYRHTFLVLNNGAYGILKAFADHQQTPGVPGLDLPGLDFVALATGYGCAAVRVRTADDLALALQAALRRPGPTVLDVPITSAVAPLL